MSDHVSTRAERIGAASRGRLPVMLVAGVLGVAAPTIADLRSGGLVGVGMYDDAVYFSAATGLVHGRLPYRDFLLLHPPGIVLALSPFAALGAVTTDTTGFLVARLCWLLLGGLSAALVVAALWPLSRRAAAVGGVFAAAFYPALYISHTLLIEQLQSTLLLGVVLIIARQTLSRRADPEQREGPVGRRARTGWRQPLPWLVAGVLAGLLPTLKIWGVVPLALILVWVAVCAGAARTVLAVAGAIASSAAVYLPFFLSAPANMWRYVVVDQTGRAAFSTSAGLRLADIEGLGVLHRGSHAQLLSGGLVVGVGAAWLVATALACRLPLGRVFAIGHLVLVVLLLNTPSWLPYYPGLLAPTAALVIGTATASALALSRPTLRRIGAGIAVLTLSAVIAGLVPARFGSTFPTAALASVRSAPGCVTADDPTTLIRLDLLSRNLDRGCRLVVDLGGYTYALRIDGEQRFRPDNPEWQAVSLAYLGSGSRTVLSRFTSADHRSFTAKSLAVIDSWPVAMRARGWVVRIPPGHRPARAKGGE